MTWLWHIVAVPCTLVLVVLAGARFGVPGMSSEFAQLVCMLVPLLAMVLICMRVPSALPSIAIFVFGVLLDLSSQEPLGYWPLIFLIATALAKLYQAGGQFELIRRLAWLVVVAGGVLCSFVIIDSIYFLRMPDTGSFLNAVAVFLIAGWVLELIFAVLGMIRVHVPESMRLVRGET